MPCRHSSRSGSCASTRSACEAWRDMQAFSLLLTSINYRGSAAGKLDTEDSTHRDFSPTDCQVLVRDGTLVMGMMDKKALGDGGGGLIHIIFNEDGWQRCAVRLLLAGPADACREQAVLAVEPVSLQIFQFCCTS
jgi:RNA polymerase Rpb1, domain 3